MMKINISHHVKKPRHLRRVKSKKKLNAIQTAFNIWI